jgi:hypothetical protein
MNTIRVHWDCPQCGLGDGVDIAPIILRQWIPASCPRCNRNYRVLITQSYSGGLRVQLVYSDHGVMRIARSQQKSA